MNDMLKRGFLLGLGAASYGKERVQHYLDELVSKGKITPAEAEQWKEELIQKGKQKEENWSGQAKNKMQDTFKDMGLATDKDIERIEERLQAIEQKLDHLSREDNNHS
ncbi:phasin family protein [Alteribacillus sp. HJP-4]|uniref:phasin family protein n=1 Tax=Alteribacillus sp. HJP-4 TaxID=2775394 RepID=UPI0035CD3667